MGFEERGIWRRQIWRAALLVPLAVFALVRVGVPIYADARVGAELAALGLDDVEYRVEHVAWDRLVVSDVRVAPDLAVDRVVIRYAPFELVDGRVESILLQGARWDAQLNEHAIRASAVARILTAGPEGATRAPETVVLADASIVVRGGLAEPMHFGVDGEVDPASSSARLEVSSPFGRHRVHLATSEAEGTTRVELAAADSAGADDHVELVAEVSSEDQGPVRIVGSGHLANVETSAPGFPVVLRDLHLEGHATWRGGRLEVFDAATRATRSEAGPLRFTSVELRAAGDDENVSWDASGTLEEGTTASLRGDFAPQADSVASTSLEWSLAGPLPAALLAEVLPGARLPETPVEGTASGLARVDLEGGWLESTDVRLDARVETLAWPGSDVSLEGLELSLRGGIEVGGEGVTVTVASGSRVSADHARVDSLRASRVVAMPELVVRHDAQGVRVRGDGGSVRARSLVLGRDRDALRLRSVAMRVTPSGERPLLDHGPEGGRTRVRLLVRAARATGALEARAVRARARVAVDVGADGTRLSAPLRVDLEELAHPASELVLADAHIDGPVRARNGRVSARTRIRASGLAYAGHALGPTSGTLRSDPRGTDLELRCPMSGGNDARLAVSLAAGRTGTVDVDVPMSDLERDEPLSRLLADLTGYAITGTAGGELHLDLEVPELGTARVVFDDARVAKKGGRSEARGVHGTLELTQLAPLTGATEGRVRWSQLVLGGVDLAGVGSARVRVDPSGAVRVADLRAALGGGEVALAPFVLDPARPEVVLRSTLVGLDLAEVLPTLTAGRANGSGLLDGQVAMRVRHRAPVRVHILDGHLAARGPGHLRLGDDELLRDMREWARPLGGSVVPRRIIGALTSFDYSLLTFDYGDREDAQRVSAHIVGEGRTVPQAVDLTVRVRGVQALVDEVWRGTTHQEES